MLTESDKEKLNKTGIKDYRNALRIIVTGGIISFLLIVIAISTLFIDGGDSAGPSFFLFSFFALAVFVISSLASLLMSLVGIIKNVTAPPQSEESKEEYHDGIIKNITLVLGIILLALVVYKILT
jgi:hypothetical protein